MPAFGFGTWQLAEGNEALDAVTEAIRLGYRLIDTARIYGNERSVGEAIKKSAVPREEIFVTTKLWPNDFGYDNALRAFDESLERLGLEYIDLYLIHWPRDDKERRRESWRALGEIYKQRRAKSIGVSNYSIEHLEEVLGSDEPPVVNQIEFNPYIYDKQAPLLDFCRRQKIVVEAYSPLARGRRLDNQIISQIAQKIGKTNAQVLLRWAIQHGTVPIPKSAHSSRIKENLAIFDFELSSGDMKAINSLGRGKSSLPFVVSLLK